MITSTSIDSSFARFTFNVQCPRGPRSFGLRSAVARAVSGAVVYGDEETDDE